MKTLKSIGGVAILCLVACSPYLMLKFAMASRGMAADANVAPPVVAVEKPALKHKPRSVKIAYVSKYSEDRYKMVANVSTRPR